jgi:hypothetical protein
MKHISSDNREFEIVEPYAPAMIESLRAVGYDLPTAIADLLDNSITAGATEIDLTFEWRGRDSLIGISDNGIGMDEDRLTQAMRIGSSDPTETRARNDLGRFGLGLKTASLSQCREFTVHTVGAGGALCIRRWNLDYVRSKEEWRLLKTGTAASAKYARQIHGSGTAVVWEKLDRITAGTDVNSARDRDIFNERIGAVERYISMVFHRFMVKPYSIRFRINGRQVDPWDPFLENHDSTQHPDSHTLQLGGEKIHVDCFVLPHHSKLSAEEHARAAGPRGWLAHQGFFIYRGGRLLVMGDWLDLGVRKEEHYKLARIRVDIPNTMDADWAIDVKKSVAKVPVALMRDLAHIGKVTREKAVAVYRHRGKVITRAHGARDSFVWEQAVKHGKISYRLNREHPLIRHALDQGGSQYRSLKALLRLIEESIPIPLIVLTSAEKPDGAAGPFEAVPSSEIYDVMVEIFIALKHSGISEKDAVSKLRTIEPFDRFPEYVENLPDTLKTRKII